MSLLPAYVALERWAFERRIVLVGSAPTSACERLLGAGARRVLVVGEGAAAPGVEIHPPAEILPIRDASVDLVARVADDGPVDEALTRLVREAGRVLRPGGVLALWLTPSAAGAAAAIVREVFDAIEWIAEVPRSVVALAPAGPRGATRRVLLAGPLELGATPPRRYLLVASRGAPVTADECVFLPAGEIAEVAEVGEGASDAVVAPLLRELDEARRALAAMTAARMVQDEAVAGLERQLRDREAELALARSVEAEAGGAEAVREGADIARDRDRLRDELARRTADLAAVEERLWRSEEAAQKERIENVRLVAEVDRLREQIERSRVVEQERARELEAQGLELRRLEVANAELQGAVGDESVTHEQTRALEVSRRRERELTEAHETIAQLRRSVDEYAATAGNLRGEMVVLQVEVEQLQAAVPALQRQLGELRGKLRSRDEEAAALQQKLEGSTAEQQHLRQRLRERLRELEVLAERERALEAELGGLRAELEICRQAIATLDKARGDASGDPVASLEAELAAQARRFADELGRAEVRHREALDDERRRSRRVELEASVRADEQEHLLYRLDSCEQRIWEMNDAADRNAARVAASLAQYAKLREQLEDLVHELEATRGLLAESEARVVEMERGLASERARLVRLGAEPGAGEGSHAEVAREPSGPTPDAWVVPPQLSGHVDAAPAVHGAPMAVGIELDSDLLRLTDAILDGDPMLVEPPIDRLRSNDDYDREMAALLDEPVDAVVAGPLVPEPEVEADLLAEVEQVMAEARATADLDAGEASVGDAAVVSDSGIIIEMLSDEEAWPDEPAFEVSRAEVERRIDPAPESLGHFVDFDLDEEGPVEEVDVEIDVDEEPSAGDSAIGIPLDDDDA